MKLLKKILLTLLTLFIVSSIGGYLYFDKKFTPPENYLSVSGISENIPLRWISTKDNPHAALLLPIQITGIEYPLFMQLDVGSTSTILYRKSLNTLKTRFPNLVPIEEIQKQVMLAFTLGKMNVSSNAFRLLDYGEKVDFENPKAINIIGTIGTDLLEKRIIRLDFMENQCSFFKELTMAGLVPFEFNKRKILLPTRIGKESLTLMYDSGTSGYELITSKEEWDKYKITNSKTKIEKGNSWGNTLTIISAPANQRLQLGNAELKLHEVTCIEGTSRIQNLLMMLSGMHGMIGNKIFINHKITLDCKNELFKVE